MEVQVFVYMMTLLLGVAAFSVMKQKRYKVVPFMCFAIILAFVAFAVTSCVMLFIPDEELGFFLAMGVLGLFLFLLGVNDIYSVFRCNQKIEAVYCGYNSYPGGRFGITSYAPVFEYICAGKVYHEQTTQTVPYRVLRNMTVGSSYPIYIHSKHPGVYVWKRRIRFTTVLMFAMALLFLTIAIQWLWP